jgi:predicted nucleic acid-binding protein
LIYLDSSVALAYLLSEERRPCNYLWGNRLFSSRLLEYEVWITLNRRRFAEHCGESARILTERIAFVNLNDRVLRRALEPFPGPAAVRTLDALHLATCEYLAGRGQEISLASYDRRMLDTAEAMGIPIFELNSAPT